MAVVVFVWFLNFGISIWNAFAVGRGWVETQHYGGWPKFMAWMGAIMSASGFTWCYLLLEAYAAHSGKWLTDQQLEGAISLGYVIIIPGVLISGLAIVVDSWARAYRTRRFSDLGVAAYNTYAQIHNTYHAFDGMGQAFTSIGRLFESDKKDSSNDDDNGGGLALLFVVLLVAVALLGGVLTTATIIRYSAGRDYLA